MVGPGARLAILLQQPWLGSIRALCASTEQKAKTTALAIAEAHRLRVQYAVGDVARSAHP